jgi:hypothetical protein
MSISPNQFDRLISLLNGLTDLASAQGDALEDVQTLLEALQVSVNQIIQKENTMALDFTALTAEVTNNTTVEGSAVALMASISTQLQAALASLAAGDTTGAQTTIAALDTNLQANDTALAAAIVANTPAAPAAQKK